MTAGAQQFFSTAYVFIRCSTTRGADTNSASFSSAVGTQASATVFHFRVSLRLAVMKLNAVEKALMNNPARAFLQKHYEAPLLARLGGRTEQARVLEIGCGRGV